MDTPNRCRYLTLFVLGLVLGSPSSAFGSSALIDAHGQVFSVQVGSFDDLFPGDKACLGEETVVALDRHSISGTLERLLVPGTCNAEEEVSPTLIYEESSGTVFLLWESRSGAETSRIYLSYLVADTWFGALEVTGHPATLRGSAQLVTTQDQISVFQSDGTARTADRRILHIVWSEVVATGSVETFYAPVILVDGEFLGHIPRLSLQDLPAGAIEVGEGSASGSFDLFQPELISGVDNKSVMIGYLNPDSQRVVAVEVRQLPAVLSSMAAEAADFTEEVGSSQLNRPGGIESLAGQVGARIIELGLGVHISIRAYLAAEVEQVILEESLGASGPGIPLDHLAGSVGARIIELGSKIFGTDGLERVYEDDRLSVIAISGTESEGEDQISSAGAQHLLRFYAVSSRPVPEIEGHSVSFLASSDGENGLLCWQEGASEIRYLESDGEAWGPIRALPMSSGFSYQQIREILRERVQKR